MTSSLTTARETNRSLAAELVHVSNTSAELARACYAAMRDARDAYAHAESQVTSRLEAERKLAEALALNSTMAVELDERGQAVAMHSTRVAELVAEVDRLRDELERTQALYDGSVATNKRLAAAKGVRR